MEYCCTINKTRLRLIKGDITEQETEAIVNAANSSLLGGGGVDGAIHRAGGPHILEECKKIVDRIGYCPPGEAVITTGGELKARFVIHTVGPIWRGGRKKEMEVLARAYHNSLNIAKYKKIGTLTFPSISTGAYGFPIEKASEIAIETIRSFLENNEMEEVRLVLFSGKDFEVYKRVAERVLRRDAKPD